MPGTGSVALNTTDGSIVSSVLNRVSVPLLPSSLEILISLEGPRPTRKSLPAAGFMLPVSVTSVVVVDLLLILNFKSYIENEFPVVPPSDVVNRRMNLYGLLVCDNGIHAGLARVIMLFSGVRILLNCLPVATPVSSSSLKNCILSYEYATVISSGQNAGPKLLKLNSLGDSALRNTNSIYSPAIISAAPGASGVPL